MGITSGIGARLYVDQYDLSGDVSALTGVSATTNLEDLTTLLNAAVARKSLLRDGSMGFSAFFNGATGGAARVLQARTGTAAQATATTGSAVGDDTFSLTGLQASYDTTRAMDGSLVLATTLQANATALEVGELLTTGKQTFAGATGGSPITYGATGTAFGWSAYLHAVSIGSGTATVTVQDSADNVTYAGLTGGAFAGVSAAGAQRISGAATATVRKYVRVNVTGTFTNLVAVVTFVRYEATPHP